MLAIPPIIHKAPKCGFPKAAAETAAEIAGETQGPRGVLGELLRRLPGGTALALRNRQTALFPAVSAAVCPALPPAPRVSPAVSASSNLRSSFGESRVGGLVDGRGNRNFNPTRNFSSFLLPPPSPALSLLLDKESPPSTTLPCRLS